LRGPAPHGLDRGRRKFSAQITMSFGERRFAFMKCAIYLKKHRTKKRSRLRFVSISAFDRFPPIEVAGSQKVAGSMG
jgi:hypothetical protein